MWKGRTKPWIDKYRLSLDQVHTNLNILRNVAVLLAENTDEQSKYKNDLGPYICEDLKIFIMALYFPID